MYYLIKFFLRRNVENKKIPSLETSHTFQTTWSKLSGFSASGFLRDTRFSISDTFRRNVKVNFGKTVLYLSSFDVFLLRSELLRLCLRKRANVGNVRQLARNTSAEKVGTSRWKSKLIDFGCFPVSTLYRSLLRNFFFHLQSFIKSLRSFRTRLIFLYQIFI